VRTSNFLARSVFAIAGVSTSNRTYFYDTMDHTRLLKLRLNAALNPA